MFPVGLNYIADALVKGILAVQLSEVVAAGRSHILEHLGHHHANALLIQRGVQGPQRFRRCIVDVIDGGGDGSAINPMPLEK